MLSHSFYYCTAVCGLFIGLREVCDAFFLERKNQRILSYSNLEVSAHDVVEDSVVKWGGLILSEKVPFNLDEVSVEDKLGIKSCWDLIRGSAVPEICTSLRSTTNYGKMSFWGGAKLEVRTSSWVFHGGGEADEAPPIHH